MSEIVYHCFEPVADSKSRVLILGTMPSPASRKNSFYYSHPRTRFWPVMATLFDVPVPRTADEKKALMLEEHIALWDVLKSCEIDGASDASIRNAVPNDIPALLSRFPGIRGIFATGQTAYREYIRAFCGSAGNSESGIITPVKLPSTSPANARMTLEELIEAYRVILPMLS